MRIRTLALGGWTLSVVCFATSAAAKPASSADLLGAILSVQYEDSSAAACPTAPALADRVRAGRALGDSVPPVAISVHWRSGAGGYEAFIDVRGDREGRRHLRVPGRDCEDLAAAVSLTLSLVLDELPLNPQAPPRATPRYHAEWGVVGTFGIPKGPSAGGALRWGLDVGPLVLALGAFASWPVSDHEAPGYVRLFSGVAELSCCLRLRQWHAWRASGCAVAGVGPVVGEGSDYEDSSTKVGTWIATGGGPRIAAALGRRLEVAWDAALLGVLLAHDFRVDGLRAPVHETPRTAGRVTWTLVHRF
jgi:hypothetical protein